MKSKAADESADSLIAAALAVPAASPAHDTVTFHAIRLLMEKRQESRARALLDKLLTDKRLPLDSVENAFRAQRMILATSYDDMLRWAPRRPVGVQDEDPYDPVEELDVNNSTILDRDSTDILNNFAPLAKLAHTVGKSSLPPWIRQDIALAVWTRAFILEDDAIGDRMVPDLGAIHRAWSADLATYRKTSGAEKRFAGALLIARHSEFNPELRPHFQGQGSATWWCGTTTDPPRKLRVPGAAILSSVERSTASEEMQAMANAGSTQAVIAPFIFDWTKSHPADPRVPEALHRLVRITRYGCRSESANGTISKQAFDLLHSRYPKSPWTAQTPYWFDGPTR
jgi:hypothetical protein